MLLLLFAAWLPVLASVELRVGNVVARPGDTALVPVRYAGDTTVVAAQFDLGLGTGDAVAGDAVGGSALADHEVVTGTPQAGVFRVVIDSPSNARLESGTWAIVPVTISSNAPHGIIPLTLANVIPSDISGQAVTASALVSGTLTVGADAVSPPLITSAPTNQVIWLGRDVVLCVEATGTGPLSYQWSRDGVLVSDGDRFHGTRTATLTISSVQLADVGLYRVAVTNLADSDISPAARLSVVNVVAWGDAQEGATAIPSDLGDAVAIAAGWSHSVALRADGTVVAWGSNTYGQTNVPLGLKDVRAIAAGGFHGLALMADGTVVGWGRNEYGQATVPPGLSEVTAIACGGYDSVALRTDGTVVAWGSYLSDSGYVPLAVPAGLGNVGAIACGAYHALALEADGTITGWANCSHGECNAPGLPSRPIAIAGGGHHSLALAEDGTAAAWGLDEMEATAMPDDLRAVAAIAAGDHHSLALTSQGTIVAWGLDDRGQTTVPQGLSNVVAIAGGAHFSLALVGSGMPAITVQPLSQTLCPGQAASFSVRAAGNAPLHHQWYFNGIAVAGATNDTLFLTNIHSSSQAGFYHAVVANALGSATSSVARLSLAPRLSPWVVGGGSVIRSPDLGFYKIGQVVTLTAIPARWHEFARWSDGNTNSPRAVAIGLTNTYTAIFTNTVPLEWWVHTEWDRSFEREGGSGGDQHDSLTGIALTPDGGALLGGYSGYPQPSPWIVRLDAGGNKLWDRGWGFAMMLAALKPVAGDGFIVATYDGVNWEGEGQHDDNVSAFRLDAAGDELWSRTFVGDAIEQWAAVARPSGDGFVFGGSSNSGPGPDKTAPNHGNYDYWLLRTDAQGNPLWDRSFGGTGRDWLRDMLALPDGGVLLLGGSDSGVGGNKTSPDPGEWLVWVDPEGNKLWEQTLSQGILGTLCAVDLAQGGGFLCGGIVGTAENLDWLLVRTDADGCLLWQRSYGGPGDDRLSRIRARPDGTFLLVGSSTSGPGGDKTSPAYGGTDLWVLHVDALGNILWDRSYGGNDMDGVALNTARGPELELAADDSFFIGATSSSPPSGTKTSPLHSGSDYWVQKFAPPRQQPIGLPVVFIDGRAALADRYVYPEGTSLQLTLQTSFPGGTIYCSTDGSEPVLEYSGPITITSSGTIRALAYSADFEASPECDPVRIEVWPTYPLTAGTGGGGAVSVNPAPGPYLSNTVVRVTATPDSNWTFLGWQGDASGTNPVVDIVMDRGKTAEAVFGTLIQATANGNGTVGLVPTTNLYSYASVVRLQAVPQGNSFFRYWTGPLGTNNITPLKYVVTNGAPLFTATFGSLPPQRYRLTGLVTEGGDLTWTPRLDFYTNNASATLTATPDPGWAFAGWSGAAIGAQNPLIVTLATNTTIVANFTFEGTAPQIITPPENLAVSAGNPAHLSVAAIGTPPLHYQWRFNAAPLVDGGRIAGALTNLLTISSAQPTDTGLYDVVITNAFGAVTTAVATLTVTGIVNQLPLATLTAPTNGSVFPAGTNILLVANAADPDGSVTQVGFLCGTNLLGTLSAPPWTFTWSNAPAGSWTLSARALDNAGAPATSGPVNVSVVSPEPPAFQFAEAAYQAAENAGSVTLTVLKPGTGAASVNYATVNGSALAFVGGVGDYRSSSGLLSFGSSELSKTLTLDLVNDYLAEPDEWFEVRLSQPSEGAFLGDPAVTTVTIRDDDASTATNSLLAVVFPSAPPETTGRLRVTLLPAEAAGQWRFPWELGWRPSGQLLTMLAADNYPVEFRSTPGWEPLPASVIVPVTTNATTEITNEYFNVGASGWGMLRVDLGPSPVASSAGWRILGETDWRMSGDLVTDLVAGTHFVEFKPLAGWSAPATRSVEVFAELQTMVSAGYAIAEALPSGVATPVPLTRFSVINESLTYMPPMPYAFNGQLHSEVGYASGAAVRERVVLTAAHAVFNDELLSFVSEVNWTFQRHAGEFDPRPLSARGWYVLSGYAAARTNDLAAGSLPGQSSPESRQNDVAALYFSQPAARGGYGGYLTSDGPTNEWLTGSRQKVLVGYPVDGASFGQSGIVPGQMHATAALPYVFSLLSNRVYAAAGFLSFPGNSGGPLCVLHPNGTYYPAAVYLGRLDNLSVVRAIDSNVVHLISLAASYGDAGTNYTGGGVTIIVANLPGGQFNPGYVEVQIGPASAVALGAAWRVAPTNDSFGVYTNWSTVTRKIPLQLARNKPFAIEFREVPGFHPPETRTLVAAAAQTTVVQGDYVVEAPQLSVGLATGVRLSGTADTAYRIEYRDNLAGPGTWQSLSTHALGSGPTVVLPTLPSAPNHRYYRAVWMP